MSENKELATQVQALSPPDTIGGQAQVAREVAAIQGAMLMAKKFPRDEKEAMVRISSMCARRSLAEVAQYSYPKGGIKVSGPSIRLAEALAQAWGNIDSGVIELERKNGESLALAYAIDLQTNYRKTMTFTVPHTIDTQNGPKHLKSSRDIYEKVANDGSRRLRNCLLAIIPGDVCDQAEAFCEKTLASNEIPREKRIEQMLIVMNKQGVSKTMIEATFGCKSDALSEQQLVRLNAIWNSLKDGIGSVSDHFKEPKVDSAKELASKLDKPKAGTVEHPREDGDFDPNGPSTIK